MADSTKEVPDPNQVTCKRCKQRYDPKQNNHQSCQFHPEWFAGETAQRWHPPGVSQGGADIHFFWTCCGSHDSNAPGCKKGPHESYD